MKQQPLSEEKKVNYCLGRSRKQAVPEKLNKQRLFREKICDDLGRNKNTSVILKNKKEAAVRGEIKNLSSEKK